MNQIKIIVVLLLFSAHLMGQSDTLNIGPKTSQSAKLKQIFATEHTSYDSMGTVGFRGRVRQAPSLVVLDSFTIGTGKDSAWFNANNDIGINKGLYISPNGQVGVSTKGYNGELYVYDNTDSVELIVGGSVNLGIGIPFSGLKYPPSSSGYFALNGFIKIPPTGRYWFMGFVNPIKQILNGLAIRERQLTLSMYDTSGRYQYGFTAYSEAKHADLFTFDKTVGGDGEDIAAACSYPDRIFIGSMKDTSILNLRSMKINFGITDGRGIDIGMSNEIAADIDNILMTIDTVGNVGIGIVNPTTRLSVDGPIYQPNADECTWKKSISGQCWCQTVDDGGNNVNTPLPCP